MAPQEWQRQDLLQFVAMYTALLLVLVLALNILLKKKQRRTNLNLPPSPPKLPIIGNLHQLGSMPHLSLQQLSKKYGPIIYLQLGEVPTIVISSARLAKEALRTNDPALSSRPQLFSAKHLFYNCTDVVFSPYSEYWRQIRKICTLELLSAKRVQSYRFVREEEVEHLVDRVAESSYPGSTNLTRILGLYANSVLCRIAFDRDFTQGGDYDQQGFQELLEEYQVLLGGFSVGDFFPSMDFVQKLSGIEGRLKNTFRRFDNIFNQLIKEHLNPESRRNHKDLVAVLLDVQQNDNAEITLTMDNIKGIILDMFAAGTDTTFITLDWAMTELMLNPRARERAQAEIRSIVKDKRFVSENDIPQLHYMRAVVKETFRLHPPAPVLVPREAMENITIDGYDIPAKARLFVNAWAIGRDPKSWENPTIFEPERFMNSNIDYKGKDFELIPFGAGRRICPAIAFSTATVELALAQLLHSFDWELPPGVEAKDLDLTEAFGITMHRISPLIVVAKPCFPELPN